MALGVQASSCREAASAMGPRGQCGATATSKASAIAAILRVSKIPPACERSGCTMSTYPPTNTLLKSQRVYSRSPRAIGVVVGRAGGRAGGPRLALGYRGGGRAGARAQGLLVPGQHGLLDKHWSVGL